MILRINDDMRRELENNAKEEGQSISSYIRGVLKKENSNNSVIHNQYGELEEAREDLDDIKQMTQFWNSTLSGIIKDLRLKMNSGAISAKDNEILINECPFSFDKFIEACNEKGIDYQKAIDKATQMVWRG